MRGDSHSRVDGKWGSGDTGTSKNPLWGRLFQVLARSSVRAGDAWDLQFHGTPWAAQRPGEAGVWGEVPAQPAKREWGPSYPGLGTPHPHFCTHWTCKCLPLTTRGPGPTSRGGAPFPGLLSELA